MMGILVGYDNDIEKKNTYLMLLSKVETERLTIPKKELLREIAVLAPAK